METYAWRKCRGVSSSKSESDPHPVCPHNKNALREEKDTSRARRGLFLPDVFELILLVDIPATQSLVKCEEERADRHDLSAWESRFLNSSMAIFETTLLSWLRASADDAKIL